MNAAAFSNFIGKSNEVGPKYWEVLQTGTLRIDSSSGKLNKSNLFIRKFKKLLF